MINKITSEKVKSDTIYRAEYSYLDEVAFAKSLLSKGEMKLKLRLPKNPTTIYSFGNVGKTNKCTDDHYNSEGDFWYFWSPYKPACPKPFMDQTILVDANMKPIKSTEITFPDYQKIEADGLVEIVYLVGPNEKKTNENDEGRQAFEKTFDLLLIGKGALDQGNPFLASGTTDYFKKLPDANDLRFTVAEKTEFTRTLTAERNGLKYKIYMYLIDQDEEFPLFRETLRGALQHADIVVYDGHSGLGYNLDITRLFDDGEASLPKDKYQVYFFNACSTFAYYNQTYFDRKKTKVDPLGTKNLDIATTSIGALFSVAAATDVVFMHSLVSGAYPSWQNIMDTVYAVDPDSSALTQINGDDDNPTTPYKK